MYNTNKSAYECFRIQMELFDMLNKKEWKNLNEEAPPPGESIVFKIPSCPTLYKLGQSRDYWYLLADFEDHIQWKVFE